MVGDYFRRFAELAGLAGQQSVDVAKSDWAVMRTAMREAQEAFVRTTPQGRMQTRTWVHTSSSALSGSASSTH